jgi:calcineurin-like phosphoesterase family protein
MNRYDQRIILHISDLHRTPGEALSNAELWDTLSQDIRYGYPDTNKVLKVNEPRLPDLGQGDKIDIVVVSGDLTQRATTAEYDEVKEFLNLIVDSLLDKDRSRLVLVPGNHDVDWHYSRGAYVKVNNPDSKKVEQAFHHDGEYRLDLRDLTLWERTQHPIYNERFKSFSEFFFNFYKKQDQAKASGPPESQKPGSQQRINNVYEFPIHDPNKQFIIFDEFTTELGIVVVGFNSCDRVDHLWHRGSIYNETIVEASQALERREHKKGEALRIAVWHHNILGRPQQSDFMDPRTAVLLAKYGFALGLHGHVYEAGRFDLLGSNVRIPIVWQDPFALVAASALALSRYNIT